jgi:hypothetical protein
MYITVQQLTKHVQKPEDDHLGRNMSLYKNLKSVKKYVKSEKGLSTGSKSVPVQTVQALRGSRNGIAPTRS